ncbi:hypothetical protein S451_17115 [Salmonella enterica subsp. enterica]|nr:hypothetical protein [Salmonella enterica subsp. enterica]ECJ7251590.1 hypothetical protein [Salmonella enterica subsp. enterica]
MRILDTQKDGVSRHGYIWTYVSGEQTGNPVVIFKCHAGRGAKYPLTFLSEWGGGYLVTDDYDAYKSVAKENPQIINTGCWSHARRRFAELYKASKEPRAEFVLKVLTRMFSLEERIRSRSQENKVRWRRRHTNSLLDKLHTWMTELLDVSQFYRLVPTMLTAAFSAALSCYDLTKVTHQYHPVAIPFQ